MALEFPGKGVLRYSLVNGIIVSVAIVIYFFSMGFIISNFSFLPLESLDAWIIYSLQKPFGIPVALEGNALVYTAPGFQVDIIAACTGMSEILFFAVLLLVFRGVSLRAKAKGIAIFAPIIFLENLLRLLFIHPLAVWFGIEAMWGIHFFFWMYGQFFILIGFFTLWYLLIARRDVLKTFDRLSTSTET